MSLVFHAHVFIVIPRELALLHVLLVFTSEILALLGDFLQIFFAGSVFKQVLLRLSVYVEGALL